MTKSGIGTQGVQQALTNQTSTQNLTTNTSIGSAEIPIWVADRKKWVTGISKKTTVNDLIYAILKQCQLVPDSSSNESSQSIIEQIASQYVLTEHQYEPTNDSSNDPEFVLSSQRVLDGESKVYKYLPKWSQITNNNNLMLKILQRELVTDLNGENTVPVHTHSHNSLASKILKKIGVSSNSNSNLNKNLVVHSQSQQTSPLSYRFVDVKLPSTKCTPLSLKSSESNPNSDTHRALLFNTIIDRENRLKKQKDKFSLLDELLRESEKKSKVVYESYNSLPNNYNLTPNPNTNLVDLNDVYCHFPEMCTHNINEVEDFTYMCCQLFKLDEAIQNQKQILNNLELDLQRELNNQNQFGTLLSQNIINNNECPEVVELRKEVNNSREQTRIQCKQLHDLDLRMRQNEQNLMLKEQELNQLLEQLYVQEVYTDNSQDAKQPIEHVSVNDMMHEEFDRINLDHDDTRANFNDDMILGNNLISKSTNGMSFRSTNNLNNQLNNAHKSLSYGNLNVNTPVIQTSPNQVLQKSQIVSKMKTSPSMDINNKNLVINTNDQLGETDSGISSMSSETAVTTTTSSTSSSSSTQIINSNTSPNSIPINNLYFNGQKPSSQFSYQINQQQYQYQMQQRGFIQQQQQQQHVQSKQQMNQNLGNSMANTKQIKSVLETLV